MHLFYFANAWKKSGVFHSSSWLIKFNLSVSMEFSFFELVLFLLFIQQLHSRTVSKQNIYSAFVPLELFWLLIFFRYEKAWCISHWAQRKHQLENILKKMVPEKNFLTFEDISHVINFKSNLQLIHLIWKIKAERSTMMWWWRHHIDIYVLTTIHNFRHTFLLEMYIWEMDDCIIEK